MSKAPTAFPGFGRELGGLLLKLAWVGTRSNQFYFTSSWSPAQPLK